MRLSDLFSNSAKDVLHTQNIQNTPLDPKQQFLLDFELASLKNGQIIQGEVVAREGSSVQILLHDNLILSAHIDKNIDLSLGKMLTFEVTNHSKENISLSPLFENMGSDVNVVKALEMADLPVNKNTVAMTEEMMHYEMPVDCKNLQAMFKKITRFPESTPRDVVVLSKMNVEVTENNLQQLENYKNLKHQIGRGIEDIVDEIPKQYESLKEAGHINEACAFMREIVHLMPEDGERFLPGKIMESLQRIFPDESELFNRTRTNENTVVPEENNVKPDITFSDIGKWLDKSPLEIQIKFFDEVSFHKDKKILKIFEKNFFEDCFITPEEVSDKRKVEELYSRLNSRLTKLAGISENTLKNEGAFSRSVSNLQNNLEFMQQINQVYSYVQLPLNMSKEKSHGELFVYTNKRSLAADDGKLSALLHLDMKNLGPVDVYVTLEGKNVNTHFYLPDENCLSFIEKHLYLLNEHLDKKGFILSSEASLRNSDIKNPVFDSKESDSKLFKYSFDVRA